MVRLGKALPWSFSSLDAYETCPRRYYLTRISKLVKEEQNETLIHGQQVHKALEDYVGGKKPLDHKYESYRPMADKIKRAPGKKLLEFKFGLTKGLTPTGFFDSNVWVRGVLDVGIVNEDSAVILDYKTGKRKINMDQLRMFAGAALATWPYVKSVKTGYIWLSENKMDTEPFTQDDKVPIWQDFAARVHRMEVSEKNDDWPAKPSGLCKSWCPVGKTNCEHCGG